MKRSIRTVFASSVTIGAIGALAAIGVIGLGGAPAAAQIVYVAPTPEVIATLTPIYHEGHPTYWYHGYWHYRDAHGAWAYYHEEPAFLRDWRGHHEVVYHYYGRR
jgi:hypothetical protein